MEAALVDAKEKGVPAKAREVLKKVRNVWKKGKTLRS